MKTMIKVLPIITASTALIAVGVLTAVQPAHAASMAYTRSADFFAALGATDYLPTTETYEGEAINTLISSGDSLNDLTYTFPTDLQGRIDNLYNSIDMAGLAAQRANSSRNFFEPGESFSVAFPQAAYAIAIFFNIHPSPASSLYINTSSGDATTGGAYDQSTFYFAGLISDTPFTTATIGAFSNASGGFTVDNLTYAAAPNAIPTPAVLPGVIGLGLGLLRQRKSRGLKPIQEA
jgi:hypothetical protein